MTRTLTALLLTAAAMLGTAACSDDDGPDANFPETETQVPAPVPT